MTFREQDLPWAASKMTPMTPRIKASSIIVAGQGADVAC